MSALVPARLRVGLLVIGLLAAGGCSHGNANVITQHLSSSDNKRASFASVNVITTSTGPVVVGEVKNTSTGPIDGVQLVVSLSDRNGHSLGQQAGTTLLSVVPTGAKASFSIPFGTVTGTVGSVSASVAPDPAGVSLNKEPLTVATKSALVQGTDYEVSGTVVNSGKVSVSFVNVVATFYDAAGKVVGASHYVGSDTSVGPGGTATFNVILLEDAKLVSTYALAAEGQDVAPGS